MRRVGVSWALVLCVSCGSGTPPPKAAADEPEHPAAAEEKPPEETAEPAKEKEKEAAKEAEPEAKPSEELSSADLTTVLQAMLGDPELGAYLQKPGRTPVKLAGPNLPKDLKVLQGTHYAQIVDGPKNPKDPVVVITRLTVDGNAVTIAYKYEVDGIVGTTRVKNGKAGWELASSRIVEH